MACLSLGFIENVLIWLVVLGAVFALINLLLPLIMGPLGQFGAILLSGVKIVMYAVIAIFVIKIIFDLISCLLGGAPMGGHLPSLH